MTYLSLIQSIISYGISFWGGTYHTHFRNLEITLNSLLKFIFNKPALFATVNLYKDLEIINLKTLYAKNICLLFYNFKTCIGVPFHNYNTRFKVNTSGGSCYGTQEHVHHLYILRILNCSTAIIVICIT